MIHWFGGGAEGEVEVTIGRRSRELTSEVDRYRVADDDSELVLSHTLVLPLVLLHRGLDGQLSVSDRVAGVRQGGDLKKAGKVRLEDEEK